MCRHAFQYTKMDLRGLQVRGMKNQVIGSRSKKLQLLAAGAVPHLVQLLSTPDTSRDLVIQALTVLGSLAYDLPDGAAAILQHGGLTAILQRLLSDDAQVAMAAVRSLQFLLKVQLP